MGKFKRVLAIALAIVMTTSLLPLSAFAATDTATVAEYDSEIFAQMTADSSYGSYDYGVFGGVTAVGTDGVRILANKANGVAGFMLKKSAVERVLLYGMNEMTFTLTPSAYNSGAVPTYIVLDSLADPSFVENYEKVAAKVDGSKLYFTAGTQITLRLPQLYADMTAEDGLKFALLSGETWENGGDAAYLTLEKLSFSENLLDAELDLVTSTGDFFGYYGSQLEAVSWPEQTKLALRAVAEAGFKYIDLDFYQVRGSGNYSELMQDGWEQIVAEVKALAKELGVEFRQAHSPGYTGFGSEEWVNTNKRCIDVCEMLGIDDLIVHSTVGTSKENCFEVNTNGYAKILPYGVEHNVNVLCENSTMKNVPAGKWFFVNGADTREFVKYVREKTGCESFACCWDTGHGNCEGDQYLDILAMGDAMKAIHFNDNTGFGDTHLLTYYGNMDVDRVLRAMKMMGYKGDFTLEVTGSNRISTGYNGPELEDGLDPYTTDRHEQEKIAFQTHTYILEKYAGNIELEPVIGPYTEDTTWYNDTNTEFVLTTVGELKGLAALAKTHDFAGKTIKLGADIVFNEGDATTWETSAPAQHWRMIPQFKGTFDGQGNTISGLYYNGSVGSGSAGFFATVENATIKNLIIENSCMISTAGSGSHGILAGQASGVTIENVKIAENVIVAGSASTGIVGITNSANPVTFKNVWMAGTVSNAMYTAQIGGLLGMAANVADLVVTVDNCLFTGTVKATNETTGGNNYVGGFIGGAGADAKVYIKNSLSVGTIGIASLATNTNALGGSLIGISSWRGASYTFFENAYAASETWEKATHRDATNYTGTPVLVEKAKLLGNLAKTNAPALDYESAWITVEGKTPELRYVAEPIPFDASKEDTSWYNTTDTEFTLNTLGEFKGFVTLSKTNTFKGVTVKLGTDIVWAEGNADEWAADASKAPATVWTPIGDQDNGFLGTFDGQGHTVSGLYCVDTTSYAAFVARLYSPGVVKNVKIVNSYFRSNGTTKNYSGAGIVSRLQNATVSGIYTDAIFEAVWDAGIVATVPSGNVTITNCWFDGTVVAAERAGGMLGHAQTNSVVYTITDCLSTGSISGSKSSGYYGGIVGIGNYSAILKMTNCLAAGDLSGVTAGVVGAVVGNNPGANKSTYTNVYATNETHTNLAGAGGTLSGFTATAVAKADILGDKAKTTLATLPFGPVWRTRANDVPTNIDGIYDLTWYDPSASVYTLTTNGQMRAFLDLAQTNDFAGKTIKLGADIAMNAGDASTWSTTAPSFAWTPIPAFKGTIDGQGYTLSGVYLKNTTGSVTVGMFTTVENATFKNLIIDNSYVLSTAGSGTLGLLVGSASGVTVENVKIAKNVTLSGSTNSGLVGTTSGANAITFKKVWAAGTVTNGMYTARIGSLLGVPTNASGLVITVENCLFTGAVKATHATSGAENYVGGFVGGTGADVKIYVRKSLSIGTVSVGNPSNTKNYAGSLVGISSYKGAAYTFFEDAYAATETYSKATHRDETAYTGTPVLVSLKSVTGGRAYTTLAALDFDSVWVVAESGTPELRVFSTATPAEPAVLTGITVTAPTKVEYEIGEELDLTDMVVTGSYSNNTTDTVTKGYEVSGFDSKTAGTKTVTVTYEGKTATFTVTVKEPVVMTGIEIKTQPKTSYSFGEALDTTGMVVTVTYSDNHTEDISEGFEVSGFDANAHGTQTITVSYNGFKTTYDITVAAVMTGIVASMEKTEYLYGEALDTITVKSVYSDASEYPVSGFEATGYNATVHGKQTITVTYKGFSTTIEVNVSPALDRIEINTTPKTEYLYGEALDTTGLTVNAILTDGTSSVVSEGLQVTGYAPKTAGQQTLTVTYNGKTATYTVTVAEPVVVESIALSGEYKTEYKYAEALDTTGLVVTVTYSDDSTAVITEGYELSGYAPETAGQQTVTVTYEGKTATFTVTVAEREPVNAQILKDLESVTVMGGEMATVTVEAIGDGLTYVWYYKEAGGSAFQMTRTFNGATYSVEMNSVRNGRSIYCVITDQYGNSVTTKVATIAMVNTINIVKDLESVTVKPGEMATVSVTAEGEGLSYRWYYMDANIGRFMPTDAFLNQNTYSVEMNSVRNGRMLYCVITDKYGNTELTETVTISQKTPIVIKEQPVSVTVAGGQTASVTVKAEGEDLTYRWYYKELGASEFQLTGAFTGDTYAVSMNKNRDGRQLYCVVSDAYGNSVTTEVVTIAMENTLVLTKDLGPVKVAEGEMATVSCTVAGEGLTYRWYYMDANIGLFLLTGYTTTNEYSVEMTSLRDGRLLYCVITDAYGNTIQTSTVSISMTK